MFYSIYYKRVHYQLRTVNTLSLMIRIHHPLVNEARSHFSCGKSLCLSEGMYHYHNLLSSLRPVHPRLSFTNKTGGSPFLYFGSQVRYKSFEFREDLKHIYSKGWRLFSPSSLLTCCPRKTRFLGGYAHVLTTVHVAVIHADVWEIFCTMYSTQRKEQQKPKLQIIALSNSESPGSLVPRRIWGLYPQV